MKNFSQVEFNYFDHISWKERAWHPHQGGESILPINLLIIHLMIETSLQIEQLIRKDRMRNLQARL